MLTRSSRKLLRRGTAMAAVLALVASAATSQRRSRQQFDDATTVTVVEVPVQVTVDGDPLTSLTKDNFEILENRKKQQITSFEMVDLSVVETEKAAEVDIPVAARRHFLALFDLSSSDPQAVQRARQAASDLLLNGLHPTDLMGVATYSLAKGPQLILGFTSDRNQVRQAFYALGNSQQLQQANDPLGIVIGDLDSNANDVSSSGNSGVDAQAEMEQVARGGLLNERVAQNQAENDLAAMTSSLEAIAGMLGAVEGRKHVLFLSEGFDSSILTGTSGMSPQEQQRMMDEAQKAGEGRTWEVNNASRYGSGEAQSSMRRMADAFRAADASIQTIDIGGLVAGSYNKNADGLFFMANETGGEMFTNFNQLDDAMAEMLQRTSVTYLLSYTPSKPAEVGEFQKIQVKLKGAPRGARVVHRPGYYPSRPYDQQSGMEKRMRISQSLVAGQEGGQIDVNAIAVPFAVDSEKSYVPVMIEVNGTELISGLTEGVLTVDVYTYAQDAEGNVRDFFARRLPLDLAQAKAPLQQSGLKYFGHLDLNPGNYTLRTLVRNEQTGASGLEISSLEVPDTAGGVALLPPMVPEAIGTWLLLREEEGDAREGVDFPFLLGGAPFLPAANQVVAKGGKFPVNLFAYGAEDASLNATAQVISESGDVTQAEIQLSGDAESSGGVTKLTGQVDPGKLEAGEYTLLVTLKNRASSGESSSSLGFTVQ